MLTSYLYLIGAIFLEICGTMLLPLSQNFTKILPTIILSLCYALSIYFLTYAIKTIPLAIVYASWAGLGIFTIAILGYFFLGQSLNGLATLGLFFIVIGVALVNGFSANPS